MWGLALQTSRNQEHTDVGRVALNEELSLFCDTPLAYLIHRFAALFHKYGRYWDWVRPCIHQGWQSRFLGCPVNLPWNSGKEHLPPKTKEAKLLSFWATWSVSKQKRIVSFIRELLELSYSASPFLPGSYFFFLSLSLSISLHPPKIAHLCFVPHDVTTLPPCELIRWHQLRK